MPKPNSIELPECEPIPILYKDRAVAAPSGAKSL